MAKFFQKNVFGKQLQPWDTADQTDVSEESDPDRRELIDMDLRWFPSESEESARSSDSDVSQDEERSYCLYNKEQALQQLQNLQKQQQIPMISITNLVDRHEDALRGLKNLQKQQMSTIIEEDENTARGPVCKKRKRKVRSTRALSFQQVMKTLQIGCCKTRGCIHKISPEQILKCRQDFWEMNEDDQRQHLLTAFSLNTYLKQGKRHYSFEYDGKPLCATAWYRMLGISNGWFYGLLKEFENGRKCGKSLRTGISWTSPKMHKAMAWLRGYVEKTADRMPHENRLSLPSCNTKSDTYSMYVADCQAASVETISWSTFKKMWRKHFSNVIIPKQNKFTKCGVCILLKHSSQSTRDPVKKEDLATKKQIHLEQQRAERTCYYGNRLKAEQNPSSFLSLIVDGMDQAKTNLPHVTSISKSEPSHFMKTHITGAISHGDRKVFAFLDLLKWKHDSNLTLNVLLRIFAKLSEINQLPSNLLLQMDNCWRECKNKYIMAFASYLVEKEIFQEVHISYLMVGHTHEDVDQFFSRIALQLSKKNAMTIPSLLSRVEEAFTPTPSSTVLDMVFDVAGWLKPQIPKIKNHIYPHAFRFFRVDGHAKMQYKNWAQDKVWQPAGEPHTILEAVPKGVPKLIKPQRKEKSVSVDDLESKLKQCSNRMTNGEVDWWKDFITKEKEESQMWERMTQKQLDEYSKREWANIKLRPSPKNVPQVESANVAADINSEESRHQGELDKLLAKQNKFPSIIITRKGETKRKKSKQGKNQQKKGKK